MKKILDISQPIVDFEGESIPRVKGESEKLILKHVLIGYLRSGNSMGIKEHDRSIAYELGIRIAVETKKIELTQSEYDTLKRMTDNGKTEGGRDGPGRYVYSLEISEQARIMVNEAETVEEKEGEKKK